MYIDKGKGLVKVTSVIAPEIKLPFQQSDWGTDRLTYGDRFDVSPDRKLAVRVSQIHRCLDTQTSLVPGSRLNGARQYIKSVENL